MTKALPFTESAVRRAVNAARKAGLQVSAVSIAPDGTVTVFQGLVAREPSEQDAEAAEWADA
jgi:hypothetical protein